jgi:hypothetical protein
VPTEPSDRRFEAPADETVQAAAGYLTAIFQAAERMEKLGLIETSPVDGAITMTGDGVVTLADLLTLFVTQTDGEQDGPAKLAHDTCEVFRLALQNLLGHLAPDIDPDPKLQERVVRQLRQVAREAKY